MLPQNFKEHISTRNYEVIGNGFNLQPKALSELERKSIHFNLERGKDITALFTAIILTAIAYGIMVILISLKVSHHIKNEVLISFSSAMQIGAGIMFGRFLPILAQKIGVISTIHAANILSAICCLAMYFYVDYFLWITVIFFFGASLFIAGVTRQSIMIDLASANTKALIISLGGMLVAIGNGFGPILLTMLKTSESFWSYAIAAGLYLSATVPMLRLKKSTPKVKNQRDLSVWRYLKSSPKIMMAGFCVNFSLSSASAFLVIYGLKIGLLENEASLLYSVLLFGTVFSVPLGYLTDLINRRFLMISSAILSLICAINLLETSDPEKIRLLLFLTFGCMMGIKLPAVVLINEKYKPTQRLAVNAAFAKFSLTGNIAGILITGASMKIFGAQGLWISIITVLALYLLFCFANYLNQALKGELQLSKFGIR